MNHLLCPRLTPFSNCGTDRTPLWRRSANGTTICNACGLYEKARNVARPPNLKRPPSFLPTSPRTVPDAPLSSSSETSSTRHVTPHVALSSADQQTAQCPGGGYCNGLGGKAACSGCPAFNNRISKTAQLALAQSSNRGSNVVTTEQVQPPTTEDGVVIACQNCHTTNTPLWRRDTTGHTICNACGR